MKGYAVIISLGTDTHLFLHFKKYFFNAYYYVTDSRSSKEQLGKILKGELHKAL